MQHVATCPSSNDKAYLLYIYYCVELLTQIALRLICHRQSSNQGPITFFVHGFSTHRAFSNVIHSLTFGVRSL